MHGWRSKMGDQLEPASGARGEVEAAEDDIDHASSQAQASRGDWHDRHQTLDADFNRPIDESEHERRPVGQATMVGHFEMRRS